MIYVLIFRKEFKEGGEAEGKEKRQAERALKQKEREREKIDDAEDEAWVAVPTKEEKMKQLFEGKTEITHEVCKFQNEEENCTTRILCNFE